MLLHNHPEYWSFCAFEILYPFEKTPLKWIPHSKSGVLKSRPHWAAHTRIGNVWEYPPPPPGVDCKTMKESRNTTSYRESEHTTTNSPFSF